ncbi:MAG: hypothetical protein ACE5E8_07025 [Acidimicrobiia bacterium]
MTPNVWWYLARSSGLVAAVMLAAAVLWGVLLSTGLLGEHRRPAWLLDLHRWLGGLTISAVGVHLFALWADSYTTFDLKSFLVPLASGWRPQAVAWGVVALYLIVAVQASSLLRPHLSTRAWRAVHLSSYPLVWFVSLHAAAAGSDTVNPVYRVGAVVLLGTILLIVLYRVVAGRRRRSVLRFRPGDADSMPATRACQQPGHL